MLIPVDTIHGKEFLDKLRASKLFLYLHIYGILVPLHEEYAFLTQQKRAGEQGKAVLATVSDAFAAL